MKRSLTYGILVGVFACFGVKFGHAQQLPSLSDSLKVAFAHAPKFYGKFESRNSFLNGRSAQVRGVNIGLDFGKKIQLGVGYHWLAKGYSETILQNDQVKEANIRLRFVAPFFVYTFHTKDRWSFSLPVQLGFGKSSLVVATDSGAKNVLRQGNIVHYEPALMVRYTIVEYLNFGGGLGYRLALKSNRELDTSFNSLVYTMRVELAFGKLYKDLKNKKSE